MAKRKRGESEEAAELSRVAAEVEKCLAPSSFTVELRQTAAALCADGKGILAVDEPPSTLDKRVPFNGVGGDKLPNTEANRILYRKLLFTTGGLSTYVSGVILHDETIRQSMVPGAGIKGGGGKAVPVPALLSSVGIIAGIKVDRAFHPMLGAGKETITQGLDDLGARCKEYYALGARFAKWRALFHVSASTPSELALTMETQGLARYASICQEHGLMPIVEPDVVMDGEHTIGRSAEVTQRVLAATFDALAMHHVDLRGILIKTNMVRPGAGNKDSVAASPAAIAGATVDVLMNSMPPSVPGCMFLSGGMSEDLATDSLAAMNQLGNTYPWKLSFSFGRALQHSARMAWMGKPQNYVKGQMALLERAKMCSEAASGTLAKKARTGTGASSASLHVAGGNKY